jgi:hypothetical protein
MSVVTARNTDLTLTATFVKVFSEICKSRNGRKNIYVYKYSYYMSMDLIAENKNARPKILYKNGKN